jgi:hypothetical protein
MEGCHEGTGCRLLAAGIFEVAGPVTRSRSCFYAERFMPQVLVSGFIGG